MDDRDRTIADMNAELERQQRRIAELEAGAAPRTYDAGYRLLFEGNPLPLWVYDLETLAFLAVNDAAVRKYGYSREEFLGMTIADIRPREDVPQLLENVAKVTEGLDDAGVWRHRRKDGSIIDVEIVSHTLIFEGRKAELVLANDITERKQAEAKLRNVSRLYAFLGQINQAIVRTRDRDELFRTICQVAIEFGRFRMAWIGLVDEATGIVRPAAHAGREEGYLSILSIGINDEATSRGPTGTALRKGVLTICDDVATDLRMLPWRAEALKRGYRSSASIPFRLKEKVVGSLNLYAAEPGFFTDDERKLLMEICTDISFALDMMEGENKRRWAEEALRESEERYRTLFETMAQGVVYQAPDGRIISANPAAERILGVSIDQMQGRTSMDPRWRTIREDGSDLPGDQHPAMEALRTGRQVNGVTMGVFHPDEHEYHWILVDAVPEFLPGETRPYRVYATFTDLTDRRRAEEDLRRRTQGLSALLEVSKGLAATLDLGTVLQATTDGISHLFGIGTAAVYLLKGDMLRLEATTPPLPPQFPAELRNAPLADHPHISRAITSRMPVLIPDMVTAVLTPAERAVMEQRGLRTVLYLPLVAGVKALGMLIVGSVAEPRSIPEPDIDLFRTLSNLAALAVENARLYTSGQQYAADLEQEITGRRKAEQERLEMERRLLHAQKLESLGILAGGIAHDFNNLLMAVLGNLDLALRKLSPVSPARLNIEHSAQAASRAADLTRQMLAYSGKGSFVVKPMDLSELVEENAHLFRSSVARTTELRVRLDRSVPAIDADAGQVQQVIMNLITNASEAIGDGMGMITLATGVQDCDSQCLKRSRIEDVPDAGRFVYLEVSDNGCGMDEQTLQRLFDPFFTTKAMGRGLGMSAILGIVRGHRGAIFVESTAGSGSTIRVLFPVSQRTLAVNDGPAGETAREAAESVAGGTVLVVDDEEIVRNVCKEMVESFGLTVLTAVDGRDAVEVFTKHADAISLILLDLSMPNMDGMTAFKELTRIKPGAKVLLCSGFDEQDSLQHFSGEELAGFIQKPYSLKNLREALAKAGLIGE